MRRSIVVANWKMNGNLTHNEKWFETFNKKTQQEELNSLDIVVAPSFPYLAQAQKSLQGSEIDLGVQDISAFAAGAHTGQVSLEMIKDFGAEYVIIGHSERRMFCHEDDNLIASKVKSVLESGLTAILCVGETLEQRESNKTDDIIAKQLDTVLELCKNMNLDKLIIAYEPVWAIGTGAVATPLQADEVHSFIRGKIAHCV